ncbi:alpha/beta hydrolase [Allokutzneria sp. A3M-2-11 16]|nr:alpha/beta hydrolase [Allokutzneria sp. A3M-2-11 16]
MAERLRAHCRLVATDMRGHGRTPLDSDSPEQYWRDLGPVCDALGFQRPILVGHSTGGYAVTAATAAGVVEPTGVCVLDGFVPDIRSVARQTIADTDWPSLADYIEQVVADADQDWLNAGVDPDVLSADADIHPSVEVYDRVTQPLALVLATEGLHANHRDRVEAIAASRANRVFVELACGHNVHLLRPDEVAAVVLELLALSQEESP